jgi:hypothetical protein
VVAAVGLAALAGYLGALVALGILVKSAPDSREASRGGVAVALLLSVSVPLAGWCIAGAPDGRLHRAPGRLSEPRELAAALTLTLIGGVSAGLLVLGFGSVAVAVATQDRWWAALALLCLPAGGCGAAAVDRLVRQRRQARARS